MDVGQDDFFVPDEPVEQVRAAFERGKRGKTRRPERNPVVEAQSRRRVVDNPFGSLVIAWGTTTSAGVPARFGRVTATPTVPDTPTAVGA